MEEPLEQHFPILPTMDDFDKLTEDATLKYKTFMDIIASGRAELDQMKLDIVEKITIHERVIIFFFFFFYIHLTPHSPTGMAGVKIMPEPVGPKRVRTKVRLFHPLGLPPRTRTRS